MQEFCICINILGTRVYLQAFILQWTNVNKALLDVKWNFLELHSRPQWI
jgi:hypothetical protein